MSDAEWYYLLYTRIVNDGTGEGKSYQRATIRSDVGDGVYGLILYPDGCTSQAGEPSYTSSEWSDMESAGVVFLPAVGYRLGTGVYSVGSYGDYWSSAPDEHFEGYAYGMYFGSDDVGTSNYERCYGYAVRLIRDVSSSK